MTPRTKGPLHPLGGGAPSSRLSPPGAGADPVSWRGSVCHGPAPASACHVTRETGRDGPGDIPGTQRAGRRISP
nr:MAG TPA: hypothetical protein [Caudoviricetes sp.]